MKKQLSIILPAYNEEESIIPFYSAVDRIRSEDLQGYDVEIIFVNDGSTDGTWQRIEEVLAQASRVKAIRLSRNFGHQAALTAGLASVSGDAVITMDCDFQDPPEVIPELVKEWEKGHEIVYARRTIRSDTYFKKWTANLYYRLLEHLSDVEVPRQVADFRLMDRAVVGNFLRFGEHARYMRGLVAWLGYKHTFVNFERPQRRFGETHYPLRKMLKLAMDGLLNFSLSPLKLALWVGLMAIGLAACFLAYMMWDHFVRGVEYRLYKWLIVMMFGFMGAQFMIMWVIAEYIGRIYQDVRNRPLYIVAEEREALKG